MSCNGCRVLRKGCSEACVLRSSLQWIESPEAQGHATVFVAKFFGRAGMLGFINAVAESQRPALFQSLLYEACGRTVNPVFGAVGLLWSGNWAACQAAVETVLKGGSLKAAECLPFSEALHKTNGNPPLKRCHGLTEPNMNLNAEPKRVRSFNSQEEPSEIMANAHVGCGNHAKQLHFLDSDAKTARNTEIVLSSEAPKQAQRPESCTHLVVPVARRVKPGYGLGAEFVSIDHQRASAHEQEHEAQRAIELDLSLNSQAFANAHRSAERRADEIERMTIQNDLHSHNFENSTCHDEEPAPCAEAGRPSSPCSFSINSEGSVASVETTEFSISGFQSFIKNRLRQEGYHLFHLL